MQIPVILSKLFTGLQPPFGQIIAEQNPHSPHDMNKEKHGEEALGNNQNIFDSFLIEESEELIQFLQDKFYLGEELIDSFEPQDFQVVQFLQYKLCSYQARDYSQEVEYEVTQQVMVKDLFHIGYVPDIVCVGSEEVTPDIKGQDNIKDQFDKP